MQSHLVTTFVSGSRDRLFQYAATLVGRDDAEDVVQEVFKKLIPKWDAIDDPAAWCTSAARNRCIDVLRKRRRIRQVSLSDFDESTEHEHRLRTPVELTTEHTSADVAGQKETHELVRDAISQLRQTYQRIIQLRFFDLRGHEEIAQI